MRALLALLLSVMPLAALAHPLAPALLQLRETAPAQYEVLWRTSVSRAQRVDVAPRLPADCRASALQLASNDERESLLLRGTLDCAPQGLTGRSLAIEGLDRALINVIVRIQPLQGESLQVLLDAQQPSLTVPAAGSAPPVFRAYLGLGVGHLLRGFDHLLFVSGLVLLLHRARPLLMAVTAFTLGHSLTLALAVLGFVRINPALTEVGIAASVLLLACEAVRPAAEREQRWLLRRPGLAAGTFGLLHGLGFAGALHEAGLPQADIPLALFAFNIGIELGQLAVVAPLLALAALWRRRPSQTQPAVSRFAGLAPAYAMGTLAAYWCLERVSTLI